MSIKTVFELGEVPLEGHVIAVSKNKENKLLESLPLKFPNDIQNIQKWMGKSYREAFFHRDD